jgi:hypothetical protein
MSSFLSLMPEIIAKSAWLVYQKKVQQYRSKRLPEKGSTIWIKTCPWINGQC